jgi:hypothetical protein
MRLGPYCRLIQNIRRGHLEWIELGCEIGRWKRLRVVQRRKRWRRSLASYGQSQNQISLGFGELCPTEAAWCGSVGIGYGRDK